VIQRCENWFSQSYRTSLGATRRELTNYPGTDAWAVARVHAPELLRQHARHQSYYLPPAGDRLSSSLAAGGDARSNYGIYNASSCARQPLFPARRIRESRKIRIEGLDGTGPVTSAMTYAASTLCAERRRRCKHLTTSPSTTHGMINIIYYGKSTPTRATSCSSLSISTRTRPMACTLRFRSGNSTRRRRHHRRGGPRCRPALHMDRQDSAHVVGPQTSPIHDLAAPRAHGGARG